MTRFRTLAAAAPRWRQPEISGVTVTIALAALLLAWWQSMAVLSGQDMLQQFGVATWLLVALLLTYHFPIHIRYMTKVFIGSVPLYLMAVLLIPPLAALVAGIGTALGEWGIRTQRDMYPSDIATQAGRWVLIGLAGSLAVHLAPPHSPEYAALLLVAALVLLGGDVLTSPLLLTPMTGERPFPLILECARGVGLVEAGQYALGITGGILALHDPWSPALLVVPLALLYRTAKTRKELHDSTRLLLEQMADSVDRRDPWTHDHSIRVMEWTRTILVQLKVTGPERHLILTAARVHDIGKMSLPDDVIQKHGSLTEEEWRLIKLHPGIGARMLETYPAFARGAEIVRGHHERWDGGGYPDGILGTAIPFGARVIAVADSFDAMTTDRPYRPGMSAARAADILQAGAETQWDPHVVEAFMCSIGPQLEEPVSTGSASTGVLVPRTV